MSLIRVDCMGGGGVYLLEYEQFICSTEEDGSLFPSYHELPVDHQGGVGGLELLPTP